MRWNNSTAAADLVPSETLIRCLGFIFDFHFDLIRACMHSTRLLLPTHAAEPQYLADGAPPLPSLPPSRSQGRSRFGTCEFAIQCGRLFSLLHFATTMLNWLHRSMRVSRIWWRGKTVCSLPFSCQVQKQDPVLLCTVHKAYIHTPPRMAVRK